MKNVCGWIEPEKMLDGKTEPREWYINYNNITTLADTVALITTNELSVLV